MRILIVDDNKEIRELLKTGFESEMFVVDTAENGEKGSYMARTNEYDIIILDNIMPKKTGAEACAEIRKAGRKTPIILLSVESSPEEKIRVLGLGADDYVAKPFSFRELLERVRAVLRRPQVTPTENFSVGHLSLNSRTQQVKRGRKNIHLTKKEYSLLELLLRHNGEVVSRGKIMEHVWDFDGNPFSNTIETHVFNLRKKIEKRGEHMIWNVPGRGYRLALM